MLLTDRDGDIFLKFSSSLDVLAILRFPMGLSRRQLISPAKAMMPPDPAGDRSSGHGLAISLDIAVYKPFVILSPTRFTHNHNQELLTNLLTLHGG